MLAYLCCLLWDPIHPLLGVHVGGSLEFPGVLCREALSFHYGCLISCKSKGREKGMTQATIMLTLPKRKYLTNSFTNFMKHVEDHGTAHCFYLKIFYKVISAPWLMLCNYSCLRIICPMILKSLCFLSHPLTFFVPNLNHYSYTLQTNA